MSHCTALWKLWKFSLTFFDKNFVRATVLLKSRFHEIFFGERETHVSQCGNYGNSLSHFFGRNFVKATFLLKKLLKSWFHEIFVLWERISRFSTLCVFYSVCVALTCIISFVNFKQNYREINCTSLWCKSISRIIFMCVCSKIHVFHALSSLL